MTRLNPRWWGRVFCSVCIVLALSLLAGCAGIKDITVNQVDLSKVKDGIYEGGYDGGLVKAVVRVTVLDHEITELVIVKHDNGKGKKAESIVDSVRRAQSLSVDAVTGATYSSKVILKATELALEKGIEGNQKEEIAQ